MPSRLRRFAGCGTGGAKGLRRARGTSRAHLPVQVLIPGGGAGGFSIPQTYRFMDAANPWRRLRAVASHLCAVRRYIRLVATQRAFPQPLATFASQTPGRPEVSIIQLQRPTLLAPEQLWRGYDIPGSQNRVERHRSSPLYPFPKGHHVTHLGYILVNGHERAI